MKFGRKIKTALYPEWQQYYIDYSALKKILKASGNTWDDQAEEAFIKRLDQELKKCEDFQTSKAEDISRRITSLEKTAKDLVKAHDEGEAITSTPADVEAGLGAPARPAVYDGGSDDEGDYFGDDQSELSADGYEERFKDLEEDVAILVSDVHDLAAFTKLNFAGFVKIVKKHDKNTNKELKAKFNNEYLDKHPFYKFNYDHLIFKLSGLNNLVKNRGHAVVGDSSAGGNQAAFERSTTKYWVHDENVVALKLAVLKHLPVMAFDMNKEFDVKDTAITSIYYDNKELELYLGRLEKTEGAEAIRMRWYGPPDFGPKRKVFVERKTHHEDWTGEKSVKERFAIDETKLNDFCLGKYTMDAEFDELVKKGKKSQKDVDGMKQLASEIQYAIVTRKLRPVMRSFYNRTAFQIGGDQRVRISLDTELTMVREDNFDGKDRTSGNWRRTDIGIDHPFSQLPKTEKELFPYAVLEVKLNTSDPPQWILDLIESELVEAVPKFSKFIHGCATLVPELVDIVPFWLPQMDQDIRKPTTAKSKFTFARPNSGQNSSAGNGSDLGTPAYHEPVSEGEEDEEYLTHPSTTAETAKILGLPAGEVEAATAFRENKLREEAEKSKASGEEVLSPVLRAKGKKYGPRLDIHPFESSRTFDQRIAQLDEATLQKLNQANEEEEEEEEEEEAPRSREVVYTTDFIAPSGKKIAIPVRVEPKVHFANERTFLKWLTFGVLLGMISTGLLNFIHKEDTIGLIAAGCFTLCALMAIAYAGGMYTYRVLKLRKMEAVNYHDAYGPTILCGALLASVVVNLVMRLSADA